MRLALLGFHNVKVSQTLYEELLKWAKEMNLGGDNQVDNPELLAIAAIKHIKKCNPASMLSTDQSRILQHTNLSLANELLFKMHMKEGKPFLSFTESLYAINEAGIMMAKVNIEAKDELCMLNVSVNGKQYKLKDLYRYESAYEVTEKLFELLNLQVNTLNTRGVESQQKRIIKTAMSVFCIPTDAEVQNAYMFVSSSNLLGSLEKVTYSYLEYLNYNLELKANKLSIFNFISFIRQKKYETDWTKQLQSEILIDDLTDEIQKFEATLSLARQRRTKIKIRW